MVMQVDKIGFGKQTGYFRLRIINRFVGVDADNDFLLCYTP